MALSVDELGEIGARYLMEVVAIDSQSDSRSTTVPSTQGQRTLSAHLLRFFSELGFETGTDEFANVLVEVPGVETAPKLALMVHMDTAAGTTAVPSLHRISAWDGSKVPFPDNDRIEVSVERYPETKAFVGEDLLHGPGSAPFGLDDKLGMAELMTLCRVLADEPDRPRPPMLIVCRPDEEIASWAPIQGLAKELVRRGVRYGYTVDGLAPFEINVENFNASQATVHLQGRPLPLDPVARARRVELKVNGARTHGATAKAEGHLNAVTVYARALAPLSRRNDIIPVGFASDHDAEMDATLAFVVRGDDDGALDRAERALLGAFEAELSPHAFKGASVAVTGRTDTDPSDTLTDEHMRLFVWLATFFRLEGPTPLLSEDSEGYEGYSNPCFVAPGTNAEGERELLLNVRIRDFDPELLAAREAHIKAVCAEGPGRIPVDVTRQYVDMGPALKPYPELVQWAEQAAKSAGVPSLRQPIRGGTGVDPFLEAGVPIANLGTGYFAPESEKELTTVQNIGRHAWWLVHLAATVAREAGR